MWKFIIQEKLDVLGRLVTKKVYHSGKFDVLGRLVV